MRTFLVAHIFPFLFSVKHRVEKYIIEKEACVRNPDVVAERYLLFQNTNQPYLKLLCTRSTKSKTCADVSSIRYGIHLVCVYLAPRLFRHREQRTAMRLSTKRARIDDHHSLAIVSPTFFPQYNSSIFRDTDLCVRFF